MAIREEFMELEDYRHHGYIDYNLSDVCIIIMSAVLCGVDTLEKILVYAHGKLDFFREKFGIEKIPSKSTLCRILRMLDPEKISGIILKIMRDRIDVVDEILFVDGKTIRSTCSRDAKDSALHVLTVYGTASGISFKQKRVNKKRTRYLYSKRYSIT